MLKSHEKFHSANGRRQVLVVDDELINREVMGFILQADYEVLYAENGQQAMDIINANKETLSLVLLDLMMPVMTGQQVLAAMSEDLDLHQIPVIVLTAEQAAEVESLNLGAADFIPKPYPGPEVILARIRRTIELSEDRQIIQSTERDPLTGLYTREYFYRYAEQYDHYHRDADMDAIVVDINHFHTINERYGTSYGDEVLRRVGLKVREMVGDTDGIVCRRDADTFLVYCPHGKDYRAILNNASIGLSGEEGSDDRVRLRMGVYPHADQKLEMERRFNRAQMAADSVRTTFAKAIGFYDQAMHERELNEERLIENFQTALAERQFEVFYQPKFDVRPEIPVLSSAEALIRWRHPELGMISPGVFIPLFEENGLIQTLDHYVWRTAAAQIRDWKDRLNFSVPVSVNVSRVDMYDPNLVSIFTDIVADYDLEPEDLLLEITESAYTQDSDQIINTVNELRNLGFHIEMDDFGSGYSSLNMISALPIDALKLDMQFIRTVFEQHRDTRLLEIIIDIAEYLGVPVIAEGVETAEQLAALRLMGCDIVQGYYFSRPVPHHEYEQYVIERRDQTIGPIPVVARRRNEKPEGDFGGIAYALSSGFCNVYYIDTDSSHYIEFSPTGATSDLQIEKSGTDFFEDCLSQIQHRVFESDRRRIALSMEKSSLLDQLASGQPISFTYRLLVDGRPVYHALKAVRANTHDDHHIVIGVSNIDDHIREASRADVVQHEVNFESLAMALSSDVESVYYVDSITGAYQQYMTNGAYGTLELENTGTNFFDECAVNIKNVVYGDDQERVAEALQREELLANLRKRGTFSMDYRLVIDGKPLFYRLKASPAEGTDLGHIIIGVSNIDVQIPEDQRLDTIRQSAATYSRIAQALAEDYFSIYYVDINTEHFVEYSSQEGSSGLGIESSGDDFFNLARKQIMRVGYHEDIEPFLEVFTKENVLHEMEENGAFTTTYRLLVDGKPTYVHLKATRMADRDDPHIVIGMSNVDAQMRREQEHATALLSARNAAYRDPLTGVKSKIAYTETEEEINREIRDGIQGQLGLALCDVNDLKTVNDTMGHAAGDELLRTACRRVCKVFTHSPVYRYGGDEFVVLLRGSDFEHREELVRALNEQNRASLVEGPVIACGLAVLIPGEDHVLADLFGRADTAMYQDKKALKDAREALS